MTTTRPLALSCLFAVVCAAVAAAAVGWAGVAGTAAGAVTVCLVFLVTSWLAVGTRRLNPEAVMAVALTSYLAKVLVLGLVLLVLWDATWLDATAFAVATMVTTVGWVLGTVWEASRRRTPIYDDSA